MMRIALFSPLPPQKSGVAVYNAQLLPYLAQHAALTLFHAQPTQVNAALRQQFEVRDLAAFAGPLADGFDVSLYQMGNNIDYHADVYGVLRRWPGIVTMHDMNVHSFYGELHLQRGQIPAYVREMAYAYGRFGADHARRAHLGEHAYKAGRYPLFDRLVNLSLGVVVHSRAVQQQITARCKQTPVAHINLHQPDLTGRLPKTAAAKAKLGYDSDDLLLASFGYVAPNKRSETVLRALAELRDRFPRLRYALVGKVVQGYNIRPLITELHLEKVVRVVGYADDDQFNTYLAATDVGVNLRYPTRGEMSATLLSLMAAGKPTLVSDVDAFAELPAGTAVPIGVGSEEQAQLTAALADLLADPQRRQQVGAQAHEYIVTACDPATIAREYIDFIARVLAGNMAE